MYKALFLILLACISNNTQAQTPDSVSVEGNTVPFTTQMDSIMQHINKERIPHGVLYDRISSFANLTAAQSPRYAAPEKPESLQAETDMFVSISPNPSSNAWNVELGNTNSIKQFEAGLVDIKGQNVWSYTGKSAPSKFKIENRNLGRRYLCAEYENKRYAAFI